VSSRPGSSNPRGTAAHAAPRLLSPALVVSIVIAAAIRFGYFLLEPPGRDQGVFSNLADGLLHGKLLYRDLWENKPPGVAWLYAAAIAVLGRGYVAIHVLQAIFATSTALVIAWLVRRAGGSSLAALAGALLYVLFAAGLAFGGWWATAQAEVFMDLPIAAALALLLSAREREGARGYLPVALAGACVGSTLLLKYSAAPVIGLALLSWRGGRTAREQLLRLVAFAAACALPMAALAAGMASAGAWQDFVRATFEFNAAYRAASAPSAVPLPLRIFFDLGPMLALYVPAACGVVAAFLARPLPAIRALAAAAAGLWVLALIEVSWQGKFWVYHYLVIALPLSVLAGAGLAWATSAARTLRARRVADISAVAGLALLAVPYAIDLVGYDRYHGIAARWTGRITAERMEATYTWAPPDYEFSQTKAVAAAVAAAVPAGQRIFVWGFEPYVYFLSRREPASRFQYDLPLMPSFTKLHPIFAAQLLDDLRRHPPALVVVVANDANDVEREDSVAQLLAWPELRAFVESGYRPAWRTGDFLCLTRRSRPPS
jgi:4-amino-4-deoxy-L-arabinose transferase-like glycosyltransferase